MAESSFRDLRYTPQVEVEMVSPSNVNDSMGVLDGVELASSKLTCGYYTDTRTSGTLRVVGDGWRRGSFLRVRARVPELSHDRVLGTYIVTADDAARQDGTWVYDLELKSVLHGLSTDVRPANWALAKNAYALKAMRQLLELAGRPYDLSDAVDYRYKTAKVFEGGKTRLERMFQLCEDSGNRLDVDPMGRVTVSRYVAPANRAWTYVLQPGSARGMVADGLQRSTDWLSMRTESSVRFTYSTGEGKKAKEHVITATARQASGNTAQKRGYVVSDYHELTEMSPKTAARATQLAKQYLSQSSKEQVEWKLSMPYLPIWEGDVAMLEVPDGMDEYTGQRRCLVKSLDIALDTLAMDVTLKETASGDEEE